MQLLQPRQMAQDMVATLVLCDLFQECARLIQLVRAEVNVISIQVLSTTCQPSRDYICDTLRQHFPNYDRRHGI
jgi:hypothetical protein